jgi:HAD superfamily 5'-nucleotidase-like hydrolase
VVVVSNGDGAALGAGSGPTFTPIDDDILKALGTQQERLLEPERQVYTNRDLNMATTKLVGFDMDYTLAIYNKQPMEQLQYDLTLERLITRAGYPEEIRALKYDPTFIVRGLLVDKRTGHLVKMDTHGRVGRVFHGKRRLDFAEVDATYRASKIKPSSATFASVDTLFSMPEACLYANLVEFFEERYAAGKSTAPIAIPQNMLRAAQAAARDQSYAAAETSLLGDINTWKLFDDVRNAIDDIHRDGTLKAIIMADLPKYFVPDEKLPLTLHKLRSAGKKLFLLTNSYWVYTQAVMSFLLDGRLKEYASWRQYFDVVVVGARKPRFFTDRDPFLEVAPIEGTEQVLGEITTDKLDRSKVYQGGNIEQFERMTGATGEEILYVGDHIFGDILKSRKDSRWRTCLIVEELEEEIRGSTSGRGMIERLTVLDEERHRLDDTISQQRALLSEIEDALSAGRVPEALVKKGEENAKRLKKEIDIAKRALRAFDTEAQEIQDTLDKHFNVFWGRLLKSNNELSRFGAQVSLYACTYTSRVSNFLAYSPVHFFRAPRELMSHDRVRYWGTSPPRRPTEPPVNGS